LNLAHIEITLNTSGVLNAIDIIAADKVNGSQHNLGAWTTKPSSVLWGVGITKDASKLSKIINNGIRTNNLNLKASEKIALVIPDNGNLQGCPELLIDLWFEDGRQLVTSASCR
jgi:hypothetical protein